MIHGLVILIAGLVGSGAPAAPELPRVLFFANPMQSDNDVVRRPSTGELSVAERHFAELSKEIFDVTITQDGSDVSRETLARYKAVVFFTAINPPGVDVDALVEWVRDGGAFVGIHSTANTYQGHPAFGTMLGARYDRPPGGPESPHRRGSGYGSSTGPTPRRDTWGNRSSSPTISTSSRASIGTRRGSC